MKDLLSYQVEQLLKANKIVIDFDELEFQIQSHPTYPSLHAVTGVLDHFNIENLALDIPKTPETLKQLPKTFLAQVDINEKKQFAVVTKTKNNYRLVLGPKQNKTLSINELADLFTGVILVVDKTESNIDDGKSKVKFIKNTLTFATVALLIIILFNSPAELINNLLLLVTTVGIIISLAIFKQEKGESTILGNAFCSGTTEKKNCNAVLASKGATIYQDLKLSDISLIYFTSQALSIFLLTISKNTIFVPQLISLLGIPVVLYSIYYQAIVIKNWCFLCLGIVLVLCCQVATTIAFFQPIFNLESTLIVVLSFSFISVFCLYQSKILKDNLSFKKTKIEYFKFKRNFDLFKTQLDKSLPINTNINSYKEIVLGQPSSSLNIMIITNPLCGHCKSVHQLIENILNSHAQSIKVTIRFNVNPKNLENLSVQITTRLLEIYHVNGAGECLKAMHDIYGDISPVEWFKKWKHCNQPEKYLPILKKEYNWCLDNAINFTPEILINGKSFPKIYNRKDLIYFIDDLTELLKTDYNEVSSVKTNISIVTRH